ncbi:unnamed protein product [Paramecium sonneborni]|uniref:Uncharacterized protein n=1 Tax=Paramecium sonneborni TaxID=65129 RepID=A0A8S1KUQ0_9CILI|nr:unnamed protein product [Paramecium sonneborni]
MYQFQTILLVQQSRDEKNFKNIKIFFQDFLLILKYLSIDQNFQEDVQTLMKIHQKNQKQVLSFQESQKNTVQSRIVKSIEKN